MKTLTLDQVVASGLPSEALSADRIQFSYDTFLDSEYPMRYFVHGRWRRVHSSAVEALRRHPDSALTSPAVDARLRIQMPRDGWRHCPTCMCKLCEEGE